MKRFLFLPLVALLAACGSTADPDDGEVGDRTTYPEGPYGTRQGTILANLAFEEIDGAAVTLHDIRTDESVRVMLLSSMAGWCGPCIEEQKAFKDLHARYGDRGLVIVSAMYETADRKKPTAQYMNNWIEFYELPYLLLRDADYALGDFYEGSPPMNMVVDVDTMEIVYLGAGFNQRIEDAIRLNLPR